MERRKLQLAPRSVPQTPVVDSPDTARSSIFGDAKPADTATRDREAAEKLTHRDEERKKEREVAAAKARDEMKEAAANGTDGSPVNGDRKPSVMEQRQASIMEAQKAAMADLGLPQGPAPSGPTGAMRGRGRGAISIRGRGGPPARRPSQPPLSPTTENAPTMSNGPSAPRPNRRVSESPADADGFSTVGRGTRRVSDAPPAPEKEPSTERKVSVAATKGFSFAAVAGMMDEPDEVHETIEGKVGGEADADAEIEHEAEDTGPTGPVNGDLVTKVEALEV